MSGTERLVRKIVTFVLLGLMAVGARAATVQKQTRKDPFAAGPWPVTGRGIALVQVNSATGEVVQVSMAQSTGSQSLDDAAIKGLRGARFKKGTVPFVRIPITFTLTDRSQVPTESKVQKKKLDDVLARFLGKGTVLKGPLPAYPRSPAWTNKSGKGVYELHADKDGKVTEVKILKPSGDATFDRETVKTLRKWRLRPRGKKLVLELPLRFTLTPSDYSVDVGR